MRIQLTSVKIEVYESIYWYDEVLTQLPFEIKLKMPPTDRGGRGYSDKYIAQLKNHLSE
jgi:hypothetical protein